MLSSLTQHSVSFSIDRTENSDYNGLRKEPTHDNECAESLYDDDDSPKESQPCC